MRPALPAAALALTFALCSPIAAQETIEHHVVELDFTLQELDFPQRDLVFAIEDLGGDPVESAQSVENLQVTETETEIRIELSGDVLFDFDEATIRPEAETVLMEVVNVLSQYSDSTVAIRGYTDSKGSEGYNLALSERRAASVRDWLIGTGGIQGANLTTQGLGEADPVAANTHPDGSDNPEGRQRNRRVEIAVQK